MKGAKSIQLMSVNQRRQFPIVFFINYKNGKCTGQVIGKNKSSRITQTMTILI